MQPLGIHFGEYTPCSRWEYTSANIHHAAVRYKRVLTDIIQQLGIQEDEHAPFSNWVYNRVNILHAAYGYTRGSTETMQQYSMECVYTM
ncbi:hypothetical protein DPMN_097238 [Dreissena polymorpha]|uniref:Uncharacterized protein n=1 Tax=Dreissena polymorpha TaxID=45954 RepID=A0A9D4L9X6_DREPO|nr:hypothetical protein DPMN_097238 [Dreissena polymorpha]